MSVSQGAKAPEIDFQMLKKHIHALENEYKQHANTSQMKLIKSVCKNKISILTGEAGTGKSFIIKLLAESYYRLTGIMPVVIAPTALAAYRAAHNTSMEEAAKTIHRYASIVNEDSDLIVGNPDMAPALMESPGLVIVDECSMLGPVMLRKLLQKISHETRLVFAGDPNQLPPVGAGGIFTAIIDLTQESIGRHTHLTENYRNSEGVIKAARAILEGRQLPDADNVFVHIVKTGEIPDKIIECVETVKNDSANTMIMAPYRSKGYHVAAVNTLLADRYSSGVKIPGTDMQIGEPVIAKRNDYITGGMPRPSTIRKLRTVRDSVFNGMKGIIKEYDPATQTVAIDFHTGLKGRREYRMEELNYYIELAYATTVHKAQGGQAKNIILVLDVAMGDPKLLYTAITRCQEGGQVHIITKKEFLDAPYIEHGKSQCLTKFKHRVLQEKSRLGKRQY